MGQAAAAVRVCVGGTFHPFHAGHEAMLRAAAKQATSLFVGVTAGELARRPDRLVPPASERIGAVRSFLREDGFAGDLEVRPLEHPDGPAASGDYDAIVVSPETVAGARRINARREAAGLAPLDVIPVPHVLAQDLLPISATRVAAGDVDRNGRRITPVRVAVGSANPVKVAAVEEEMARILALPVHVQGHAVPSGVPEQPRQQETMDGARRRAGGAMAAWPQADYAVGVEAGLNRDDDAWYDVQACAVLDVQGHRSQGWGPAFQYPGWVTRRALAGEMVSDILGPMADGPQMGGTTGAIGFLTGGRVDRRELTRIAVLMAFVPRIRRALYG